MRNKRESDDYFAFIRELIMNDSCQRTSMIVSLDKCEADMAGVRLAEVVSGMLANGAIVNPSPVLAYGGATKVPWVFEAGNDAACAGLATSLLLDGVSGVLLSLEGRDRCCQGLS
jgi:hypothetical protein